MDQWNNLNLYTQNPEWPAIVLYFVFVIFFTYFYSLITFNPDKMSDTIQKRGGFIPGIRPGNETAAYIKDVLNHLSRWGGVGLGLLAIYSYILYKIPFIQDISVQLGSIPVIVTGSGIIIIV
jgi:preprotein translocase subunit SecY